MIVFLDTETSGLKPGYICQLSCVFFDGKSVKGKNTFFKVPYVEYGAYKVHGFSTENLNVLSGGKTFSDNIDEIKEDLLNADLLVSHNTAFDFMFLREEFDRCGVDFDFKKGFCSMKNSVNLCRIPKRRGLGYKYPKLEELCKYFYIDNIDIKRELNKLFSCDSGYHDARFDTTALYLAVKAGIEEGVFAKLKEFY